MTEVTVQVRLRERDIEALVTCVRWALAHHDLDLGPGLHPRDAEDAIRLVEQARP